MSENTIFDQADVEENKVLAIVIAVCPLLFFLIYCVDTIKDSSYCKHVANNSAVLLILGAVLFVVGLILGVIPVIGWIVGKLIWLIEFVYLVLNTVDAAQGSGKKLPIIGGITIIK